MSHRRLQAMFAVFILLVMVSTSMTAPANYQLGYNSYKPQYGSNYKREPQHPIRKGRRGDIDSAYNYGADREQRRNAPDTYYEPISQ